MLVWLPTKCLYYGFDDYGYLILSTDNRFYQYTAYRPAGMYYAPGKELTDGGPKMQNRKSDGETKVKSVSRAIKARVIDEE